MFKQKTQLDTAMAAVEKAVGGVKKQIDELEKADEMMKLGEESLQKQIDELRAKQGAVVATREAGTTLTGKLKELIGQE